MCPCGEGESYATYRWNFNCIYPAVFDFGNRDFLKIVPQSNCYVVERLGVYHATWETGLHFKLPFFDRVAKKVSLKEQVVDFKPQPVITRDNVTMQIDTVVFFQVTDA